MAEYINPALEVDSSDIEDEVYTYVQQFYPDFDPAIPGLITVLTEAYSQQTADNRSMATDVPPEIARYFGPLFGIYPTEAAPATGTVTIVMVDNAGYDFDPGELLFRLRISGEEYAGFVNSEPVHIAAGGNTAAGIMIVATTDGAEGNNLPGPVELITVEDKILSVTLTGGNTGGGADEDDIDGYLEKLSGRLRLLADSVVRPEDAEEFVKALFPDVDRVLALDGYDPDTNTWNNEKFLTVVPIDSSGASLPALHPAILAALNLTREWNFEFRAMAPTYTALTIDIAVKAHAGWDEAGLALSVEEAIADQVSPARHGQPESGDERQWVLDGNDMVRFPGIMQVTKNVEGVNYIVDDEVTINGVANTSLALAGIAPLPAVNPTINVTVVPADG